LACRCGPVVDGYSRRRLHGSGAVSDTLTGARCCGICERLSACWLLWRCTLHTCSLRGDSDGRHWLGRGWACDETIELAALCLSRRGHGGCGHLRRGSPVRGPWRVIDRDSRLWLSGRDTTSYALPGGLWGLIPRCLRRLGHRWSRGRGCYSVQTDCYRRHDWWRHRSGDEAVKLTASGLLLHRYGHRGHRWGGASYASARTY